MKPFILYTYTKSYTLVVSMSILLFCNSCQENHTLSKDQGSDVATVYGTIRNYDRDTLYIENHTENTMFLKNEGYNIPLYDHRSFHLVIPLKNPAYFKLHRNLLYLSPGDSLQITIDYNSDKNGTEFDGKGAEANHYLAHLPYAKSGSFWGKSEVSEGIRTFQEVPMVFKDYVEKGIKEINQIKDISDEFKDLEVKRLRFHYINSLLNSHYLLYNQYSRGEISEEDLSGSKMKNFLEESSNYYKSEIVSNLNDYNNINYLQLEVFQPLVFSLYDDSFRKKYQFPPLNDELQEYVEVQKLLYGIKANGHSSEMVREYDSLKEVLKNPNFKSALQREFGTYENLKEGVPATDLTFYDLNNEQVQLSDFKGKVVVIDFWATWCGPYMQEKPYWNELEELYKNNNDVVMLSVSIDRFSVFKNYFEKKKEGGKNQLQASAKELKAYKIDEIPRFFVIDQDFKIVNVFAPRPSSGNLDKLIKATVSLP